MLPATCVQQPAIADGRGLAAEPLDPARASTVRTCTDRWIGQWRIRRPGCPSGSRFTAAPRPGSRRPARPAARSAAGDGGRSPVLGPAPPAAAARPTVCGGPTSAKPGSPRRSSHAVVADDGATVGGLICLSTERTGFCGSSGSKRTPFSEVGSPAPSGAGSSPSPAACTTGERRPGRQLILHKDAIKDKVRPDNPARGAIKPPKDKPVIGFWTSVEFVAFIKVIDLTGNRHDQALYRLAVQTGMRRGELLGLRWANVDLEARHLTVIEQLSRRTKERAASARRRRGPACAPST
jgi:Phage integrase family